jgi:hypothetical protein
VHYLPEKDGERESIKQMTSQIAHRLQKLETLMAPREAVPNPKITLVFVEAADGKPTGRVTYVTYGEHGIESKEEGFVPPEELRKGGQKT